MFVKKKSRYRLAILFVFLQASVSFSAPQKLRLAYITHAPATDPWWNVVKNGIQDARVDFEVTVDYRYPLNGDISYMSRLIEQAAAREYDGVILTIADFDLIKNAVKKLKAKGIPYISVNSGTLEQSESIKAWMHIGQPEYKAGLLAGKKAKAEWKGKQFLCVNHIVTNPISFDRCRGFNDGMDSKSAGDYQKYTLDVGLDPITIQNRVKSFLRHHPEVDTIVTLGPISVLPTLKALKKGKGENKFHMVSFDLSEEIMKGLKDQKIHFAIDQQPYLMGYLPIALMSLVQKDHGTLPFTLSEKQHATAVSKLKADKRVQGRLQHYALKPLYEQKHILSGPGMVDLSNLNKVEKYAGKYR